MGGPILEPIIDIGGIRYIGISFFLNRYLNRYQKNQKSILYIYLLINNVDITTEALSEILVFPYTFKKNPFPEINLSNVTN